MAFASSASPFLFSSIIFCDPVLPWPTLDRSVRGLTTGAIVRREEWSSTEEAREGFLKKAFFRQWDSRVLDSYCTHGVKAVASGGAALKTRARDEAVSAEINLCRQSADHPDSTARLLRPHGGRCSAGMRSTRVAAYLPTRSLCLRRLQAISSQRRADRADAHSGPSCDYCKGCRSR